MFLNTAVSSVNNLMSSSDYVDEEEQLIFFWRDIIAHRTVVIAFSSVFLNEYLKSFYSGKLIKNILT